MVRVVWSDVASENLEQIISYIEAHDERAAASLATRLYQLADSLSDFPNRGRLAGGDKRELASVPPYVMRYRVMNDRVVIISVRHGRQLPLA